MFSKDKKLVLEEGLENLLVETLGRYDMEKKIDKKKRDMFQFQVHNVLYTVTCIGSLLLLDGDNVIEEKRSNYFEDYYGDNVIEEKRSDYFEDYQKVEGSKHKREHNTEESKETRRKKVKTKQLYINSVNDSLLLWETGTTLGYYLRLPPYKQTSVQSKKLAPRFYGPFLVLQKVGEVYYKLDLPEGSLIHLVFHVSNFKAKLGQHVMLRPTLPVVNADMVLSLEPMSILATRSHHLRSRLITQVLVQWHGKSKDDATWENLFDLQQSCFGAELRLLGLLWCCYMRVLLMLGCCGADVVVLWQCC
uniref:Tf2-1-like SH3-like domain-containing protein n=1 Tax=Quercus lobata TaxID=97700 RepID=A0A7N2LQ17_QUELO